MRAPSLVVRVKFMAEVLRRAHHANTPRDGELSPQGRKALYRHAWVVYGKAQLAQARAALQQPAPNPLASGSAAAFMARVVQTVIQTLPGLRHLTTPAADITTADMLARAQPWHTPSSPSATRLGAGIQHAARG